MQTVNYSHANALEQNALAHEDTVISCRYELKYRIPEVKARAVAKYIMAYINPDRYSIKCKDYAYPVSSLYFDRENLQLCNETIQGKKNRFKLRIRCYDDDVDTLCFFEIKRRINDVIHKDRARLSKKLLQIAVHENYMHASLCKREQDTLKQFQFYLQILRARPIVLVRYMRQAFEENAVNRVRLTFDRQLSFKAVDQTEITLNGAGWQAVPIDFVILEIKFTSKYPLWLSRMVKIFDLNQSAMSKYVSSVKQFCSLGFCAPKCLVR
ncbi:MAG: polyphosphate polymerase domain-containing protein [Phycisphaerae bacterium]|jgi:SPX domain protein involved in polyphosphate accumulation